MLLKNGMVVNKVSVHSIFTYHLEILLKKMWKTITRTETACDYLNKYNQGCMTKKVEEIFIKLISDLKYVTFSH